MIIIDYSMGFFSKFFKAGNDAEKYNLQSAEKLLKERMTESEKIIEAELRGYHKQLLNLDNKLKNSLQKLSSAVPKEKMDEQLLFMAQTGRSTFKNKISKVSEVINKSVDFDFHSFSKYYSNCMLAVNEADTSAVKEFRTIGIVFEEESRDVVNNLRHLKEILNEMENRMKKYQQILNPYETTSENINELQALVEKLSDGQKKTREIKNDIENKQKRLAEMKKFIDDLTASEEWKEYLNQVEKVQNIQIRKTKIMTQFNEMISSVERPMKKAKKIIDTEDKNKIFENYLSMPFETFLKDEKEEMLTSFLEATKKLLAEKKIEVKENLRNKAIDNIDEWMSKKIFTQIKEQYLSSIRDLEEMKRLINENKFQIRKTELERETSETEKELVELKKNIEMLEKEEQEDKKIMQQAKEEIEKKLAELLNSKIEVET
jgi:acyl carrier protein phosphodiesterase